MSPVPTPPASPEAERAVLGACLISPEVLSEVISTLKPDDFYDANNRTAFDVMVSMYSLDRPVDFLTLINELESKSFLGRLGGKSFITNLASEVTSTANVNYYIDIVRDRSMRRKLVEAANAIMTTARDYEKSVRVLLDEAEKLLMDAGQNKRSDDFVRIRDIIPAFLLSLNQLTRDKGITQQGTYRTELLDLDSLLNGGLKPGSLNILAARPSMGKTALALNIAQFGRQNDNNNAPVLIFSLEMPTEQLLHRMIAAQSGVNLSSIMNGSFTAGEFSTIKETCDTLAGRELYISDATQLSAVEFRSRCRRFKMRHPDLALVVIDYLQLMTSGDERASWSRQQEVSDISRMLKAVAREINCPVLALSQLSRASEQRTDKKPQLSDLRDSGAIEQDADTVMMLYRQDYYGDNERNDLTDSEAELRIAKNRNGGTGVVKLIFKREITLFCNRG